MKAVIGIIAGINSDFTSKVEHQYIKCIEAAGGIPIIIPYTEDELLLEELLGMCDGVMLTGGVDVSPQTYNKPKNDGCGETCKERDEFELFVFEKALYSFKPILAICRGAQLINVALGGTLYQDIPSEYPNAICHKQNEDKHSHSHEIAIVEDTPLFELLKQSRIKANSFHHQGIKELGRLLEVMAIADDGIIEAVYMPSYTYLRAYQWHPERLCEIDTNHHKLFEDFIEACKQ